MTYERKDKINDMSLPQGKVDIKVNSNYGIRLKTRMLYSALDIVIWC